MNAGEIIVVIPYYKNELTDFEKFSLAKALQIFSNYPVCLVSPEGLKISPEYRQIKTERFDKRYFSALESYNQLLLSNLFYERFLDYRYILVYQLDALVFKDELDYWCSLDYDYYGAPWNKKWKRRYYNFFGLLKTKVGNGGFSLRKTEVFYKMTCKIKGFTKFIRFGEDIFWCTYGRFLYSKLKIIDYESAIRFSFESQPAELFSMNGYRLPFGCHAYEKNNLSFWKRVVFDLPEK